MNLRNKKIIIISSAVLLTVLVAAGAAILLSRLAARDAASRLTDAPSSAEHASSLPIESEPADNGIRLSISSPESNSITVTEPIFTFTGTSDPAEPLTVNGEAPERSEDGGFAHTVQLNVGKNVYTFLHKGEEQAYTVNYRYVIIQSYRPSDAQAYPSGSTLVVSVRARKGSRVTAAFNGAEEVLTESTDAESDSTEFTPFSGVFKLPSGNAQNLNLGKIRYTATHNGVTESFSSGSVTCKRSDIIVEYDAKATPTGGKYMNVGSGYIAEIVAETAETFDGNVTSASLKNGSVDWSRPTNNYLPRGTVDYCSPDYVIYESGSTVNEYVTLRAGYRVYKEHQDKPYTDQKAVVKQYMGTLPDHNEISLAALENGDTHTTLTVSTAWKAPFYFDLLPQSYAAPASQNYSVTDITFNYIDIIFCYATVFEGEVAVPEQNPLFSRAEVIKNMNADGTAVRDYTLRLYLKKTGAFYGWDCAYNADGQLVFSFLNPKQTAAAANEYGIDLKGAKILIDVGHGGKDPGAAGFGSYKNSYCEKQANLELAFKLKAELEKIGAAVVMTRTGDTTSSTNDKTAILKREKPDFCIAIHHDSSTSAASNGFGAYYSNAFSKRAAEYVLSQTQNSTGLYNRFTFKWHYYFMCRITTCPVVLTENGFMSNLNDFNNIKSPDSQTQKAKAITRGIADYFNSVNP